MAFINSAAGIVRRAGCNPQPGINARCSLADAVKRNVTAVAVASVLLAAPVVHAQNILVYDHDQTLVGADFSGRKDLVGAIFTKSNATRATFAGADLRNAQLDDTILIEATLDGAGKGLGRLRSYAMKQSVRSLRRL